MMAYVDLSGPSQQRLIHVEESTPRRSIRRWDGAAPSSSAPAASKPAGAMDHPPTTYLNRLQKSFDSGKYSDLTIACNGRKWKVHRFQLSQHSEVFEAMITRGFRETGQSEIDLPEDDSDSVNSMLRYMYHLKYDYETPADGNTSYLISHMRVARVADKYAVTDLADQAYSAFHNGSKTAWSSDAFAEAISEAYENDGYDRFRESVVQNSARILAHLKKSPDSYKAFWEKVETISKFAFDILRYPGVELVKQATESTDEPEFMTASTARQAKYARRGTYASRHDPRLAGAMPTTF